MTEQDHIGRQSARRDAITWAIHTGVTQTTELFKIFRQFESWAADDRESVGAESPMGRYLIRLANASNLGPEYTDNLYDDLNEGRILYSSVEEVVSYLEQHEANEHEHEPSTQRDIVKAVQKRMDRDD